MNVTVRRVRVTTVAVEKQHVLLIPSLSYLTRIAHAPYYGLSDCTIFFPPHYLINGLIFGKTLLNMKRVFLFSLQILPEIFLVLRRIH